MLIKSKNVEKDKSFDVSNSLRLEGYINILIKKNKFS